MLIYLLTYVKDIWVDAFFVVIVYTEHVSGVVLEIQPQAKH